MTDKELLNAISDILDDKLKVELKPIKDDIQLMKDDIQLMKDDMQLMKDEVQELREDVQDLKERVNNVESQLKRTKEALSDEIHNSERLVLSEVERVHRILNDHKNDKTKHPA